TNHSSQLFRYFGASTAKFGILTNGIIYRFYTDLDEPNKMDETPFLEIDLLDLRDQQIQELKKFCKNNFNLNEIIDTASDLKFLGLIRNVIKDIFSNPSDDYVRFILGCGVYNGVKTQNIVDRFKPLVKKSMSSYINELVNEKIQTALKTGEEQEKSAENQNVDKSPETYDNEADKIVTTDAEMEAFYIVKSILRNHIDISLISYKDTQSYFSILFDNKVTKWICRLVLKDSVMYMIIQGENREYNRYPLETIDDLYNYSELLIKKAKMFCE
ncbi:MAG: endonuclease, partial [Peptococcaceae bacterium]|nr:endonuclease [Peptococcaceae bacterium]